MNKRLFTFSICCLLLIFTSSHAGAAAPASGTCGKNAVWSYENGLLIISGTGAMDDYDTMANWGSNAPWFDGFHGEIRRVVIEEGITTIGNGAFANCYYLQSVTIPGSVTSIGNYAFYNIDGIMEVTIPAATSVIGDEAFNMCSALQRIDVDTMNAFYSSDENGVLYNKDKTVLIRYPAGNKAETYSICNTTVEIGAFAFYNADLFRHVILPQGLISIGASAFGYCDALISIRIPSSVSNIGTRCFSSCDLLETITVDEENPFFSSDSLGILYDKNRIFLYQFPAGRTDSSYSVPQGIITLGSGAFEGAELNHVILPEGLTTIESYAFECCFSLQTVVFPSSLKTIGHDAFYNDYDLDVIILPGNLETIEYRAFGTTDPISVFFEGSAPTSCADNAFADGATLYYRSGQTGWDAPVWSNFDMIPISADEKVSLSVTHSFWRNMHTITVDVAPYRDAVPNAAPVSLFCAAYDHNGRMLESSFLPLDILGGTVSSKSFQFTDKLLEISRFQVFCLMDDGSLSPCGAMCSVIVAP